MVANNGRVILKYFPIPESDAITPSVTYKNLEDRINDYKIYCKKNKGFTEYTDIEIEAIEPILTKMEDI